MFKKDHQRLVSQGTRILCVTHYSTPTSTPLGTLSLCILRRVEVALIVSYYHRWVYIGVSLKPNASHTDAKGYLLLSQTSSDETIHTVFVFGALGIKPGLINSCMEKKGLINSLSPKSSALYCRQAKLVIT